MERVRFQLKAPHRAVLAIALVGTVVASLTWLCVRDPKIAFLPGDGRAEWMLFPSSPDAAPHRMADLGADFRREFVLDGQPRVARLSVRAAKRVQLKINGNPVDLGPSRNWKDFSNAEVPASLHAGTNTIEVRVFNENGPPALWLVLATDQLILRSDRTWEGSFAGSAWRRAALAARPRMPGRGNPLAGGEETPAALAVVWPIWAGFGGLSMVVWVAGRWWFDRIRKPKVIAINRWLSNEAMVPLLIIAALWVALFCNNTRSLPLNTGFDAPSHIDYIGYLQEHKTLPLPNEGFEMFQPPLYYAISAVTLSTLGLSVSDGVGGMVLRLLTACFALVHIMLVFLSLRLLFPGQLGRQLVGLALAAFLPMQLYLSHYVTNETLAATLATAAIFLCLRLLQAQSASVVGYAGLGFCLGAALLTKATGVLLVPFIVVAVAGRRAGQKPTLAVRLAQPGRDARGMLRGLRLVLSLDLAPLWHAVDGQLERGFGVSVVAGQRLPHAGGLHALWPVTGSSVVQRF